jgi:superfamily II DNA/RNA helicase
VLISEEEKIPFMLAYISVMPQAKIMVFVSTISEVEYLDFLMNNMVYRNSNGQLTEERVEKRSVYKIHGDLDQKLRTNTYFNFRKEKVLFLNYLERYYDQH